MLGSLLPSAVGRHPVPPCRLPARRASSRHRSSIGPCRSGKTLPSLSSPLCGLALASAVRGVSSLPSVARLESPRRFAPVVRLAVRATPSLSHKTPSCFAQGFASLCSGAPSYGGQSCKSPALGSCPTSSTSKGHRHKDSLFAGLGIHLYLMVLAS